MLSTPLFANTAAQAIVGLAELWRLWLPLVVGAAAVYLLLPRPRAYPLAWGALAGAVALLLGGGLLVRAGAVNPETILFYAFSGIAVVSGVLLVTQQNPARAALSFALVILSTCGLFLLLAAPFLMAATIIIYAGAIVVTFLFVLMLAQQQGRSDADARSREPLLATITGFVLLATILYVLRLGYDTRDLDALLGEVRTTMALESGEAINARVGPPSEPGRFLFARVETALRARGWKDLESRSLDASLPWPDPTAAKGAHLDEYRGPLEKLEEVLLEARSRAATTQERLSTVPPPEGVRLSPMSGTPASTPPAEVRRNAKTGVPELPAENSAYLGRSLFTDYLLPVELGGLLLLVATVGAIAIAQRREG